MLCHSFRHSLAMRLGSQGRRRNRVPKLHAWAPMQRRTTTSRCESMPPPEMIGVLSVTTLAFHRASLAWWTMAGPDTPPAGCKGDSVLGNIFSQGTLFIKSKAETMPSRCSQIRTYGWLKPSLTMTGWREATARAVLRAQMVSSPQPSLLGQEALNSTPTMGRGLSFWAIATASRTQVGWMETMYLYCGNRGKCRTHQLMPGLVRPTQFTVPSLMKRKQVQGCHQERFPRHGQRVRVLVMIVNSCGRMMLAQMRGFSQKYPWPSKPKAPLAHKKSILCPLW